MPTDVSTGHDELRITYSGSMPSTRCVAVEGEADLATARYFQRVLRGLLADSGVVRLMLDLTGVRHLDCARIAALLAFGKTHDQQGDRHR